jgi:hypothetical protein
MGGVNIPFAVLSALLFIAWFVERDRRRYEAARAAAFQQLSEKLKERLRAEIDRSQPDAIAKDVRLRKPD